MTVQSRRPQQLGRRLQEVPDGQAVKAVEAAEAVEAVPDGQAVKAVEAAEAVEAEEAVQAVKAGAMAARQAATSQQAPAAPSTAAAG